MQNIEGKIAFITGGASGIGLGMAKVFATNGIKCVIVDRRQDALDEAMEYFNQRKYQVHAINADITDREAYARAADEAEKVFGKIHILVNNAGASVHGPTQNATYDDWDYIMAVNVGGVINGLVTVLPRILKHGEEGHVVTTSSTVGLFAIKDAGLYCTTKFAVAGMMESLATDLQGTNVGASVFFPGPVKTNFGVSNKVNRKAFLGTEEEPQIDVPENPDDHTYMDPIEVGERVLRGIKRNDLFIISHPEFKDGIIDRNNALVRSVPVEPANEKRIAVLKRSSETLLRNPFYDKQTTPGELR